MAGVACKLTQLVDPRLVGGLDHSTRIQQSRHRLLQPQISVKQLGQGL